MSMKIAVVIPSLEPNEDLVGYVQSIIDNDIGEVVVVDDGSSEGCRPIFAEIAKNLRCVVLTHPQNRGKGAALKTAVAHIKSNMPRIMGIVTADADGQHTLEDVERMAQRLKTSPDVLLLGVRVFDENTPKRSRRGNLISSKLLRILHGIDLDDTQTGLRGIGRDNFDWLLTLRGERYEYELSMLIESKKQGIAIDTITISTVYFDNNAGSHFSTVKDAFRISRVMMRGIAFFAGSAAFCAGVDIGGFALILFLIGTNLSPAMAITVAAVISRVISSICNYIINKKIFAGEQKASGSAIRYALLWLFILGCSTGLVNLFGLFLTISTVIIKIVIDLLLSFVSYRAQQGWVFSRHKILC